MTFIYRQFIGVCIIVIFLDMLCLGPTVIQAAPEVIVDKYMPSRNATTSYADDPYLTFIKVDGLSSLEFGLLGCFGAKILLLRRDSHNFTNFIEISLGGIGNNRTTISECLNETFCELRNMSLNRPMYCFGTINFFLSLGHSSSYVAIGIGVRNRRLLQPRLLTSWTLQPFSDNTTTTTTQLAPIEYVAITNEQDEMTFQLIRDADMNFCYLNDDDESSVDQCGDNFLTPDACVRCGCCYNEHLNPPCFQSKALKDVLVDFCLRSVEDLTNGAVLLTNRPAYLYENVSFLFLIHTPWPNFTYLAELEENVSVPLDNLMINPSISHWAQYHLPSWVIAMHPEQNTSSAETLTYHGILLSHVYNKSGSYLVNFTISAQMKLKQDRDNFTVQSLVHVIPRPTLSEVINFTVLAIQSPAFNNEQTEFIYFIQNSFPEIRYNVDFGDGTDEQVFSTDDVEEDEMDSLPDWFLDANNTFSNVSLTSILSQFQNLFRLAFSHTFQKPREYEVSVIASGHVLSVNRLDFHVLSANVSVCRRPKLRELVNRTFMLTPATIYVNETLPFACFLETYHDSLLVNVNYGDWSSEHLDLSGKLDSVPVWITRGEYSLGDGIKESDDDEDLILNSTLTFNGVKFNHTYDEVGIYIVVLIVSGYPRLVSRFDVIKMTIEVTVKARPTLSEATGRSMIFVESSVYVNKTTRILVATEHFFTELLYEVNFGWNSSKQVFTTDENVMIPDWVHDVETIVKSDDHSTFLLDLLDGTSSFRIAIVEHTFEIPGTHRVVFYVTGFLEVVTKCSATFVDKTIEVLRRPTLSELAQTGVTMLANNDVYADEEVNVFVVFLERFSNLRYTVDFSNDDVTIEVQRLNSLPKQFFNESYKISGNSSAPFLNVNVSTLWGGSKSLHYMKPGKFLITVTMYGLVDIVGKADSFSLSLPIFVKLRPTLKEVLGRVALVVRSPVYVTEDAHFILMVENYHPELSHDIYFSNEEINIAREKLILKKSSWLPDWLKENKFESSEGSSDQPFTEEFYWTSRTVKVLKPKSFQVKFNVSGKLDVVGRLENVVGSVLIRGLEAPSLEDLVGLGSRCLLLNLLPVVAKKIHGFVFVCKRHMQQMNLSSSIVFGDGSLDEHLNLIVDFEVPTWAEMNKSLWQESRAGENYNGAAFYHMYPTAGQKELRVVMKSRTGFRVKGPEEYVIKKQIQIEESYIGDVALERCRLSSLTIQGGGVSSDSPVVYRRNEIVMLEAILHSECKIVEQEFGWQIYQGHGIHVGSPKVCPPENAIDKRKMKLDAFSLNYGIYTITVKVGMPNIKDNYLVLEAKTWILIEPSPLHVELLLGPVAVTDFFTSLTLTAVNYEDIDEETSGNSSNLIFTWFCTGSNEELHHFNPTKHQLSRMGGCFGDGLKIADHGSSSFTFRPDKTKFIVLPAVFVVHVYVSKSGRTPYGSSQAVVVMPTGPPDVRIVCVSNCDTFLDVDQSLVLDSSCLDCSADERLEYKWELEPMCSIESIEAIDWLKYKAYTKDASSQLHVRPRVFLTSSGNEQYRIRLIVTRQEKSQSSASYIVRTRARILPTEPEPSTTTDTETTMITTSSITSVEETEREREETEMEMERETEMEREETEMEREETERDDDLVSSFAASNSQEEAKEELDVELKSIVGVASSHATDVLNKIDEIAKQVVAVPESLSSGGHKARDDVAKPVIAASSSSNGQKTIPTSLAVIIFATLLFLINTITPRYSLNQFLLNV